MNGEIPGPEIGEEEKTPSGKVVLYFFRHGAKEGAKEGVPDEELLLTPKGRKQALAKGQELHPTPEKAIAIGSPRRRTVDTALRVLTAERLGSQTVDQSLEEIEAAVNKHLRVGKKSATDARLDYHFPKGVLEKVSAANKEGKILAYEVAESDQAAIESGDPETTSYTIAAGNIAEIVRKYLKVSEVFTRKPDFREKIERYLGTHAGVSECFLAKALEVTQGKDARDKFVGENKAGFTELEGFSVEISRTEEAPEIVVTYGENQQLKLSEGALAQIIEQKQVLQERIREGK